MRNINVLKWVSWCLSFMGLLDSAYLTLVHYTTPAILACPENSVINCAQVVTSPQSVILGIPIAVYGLLFFIFLSIITLPKLRNKLTETYKAASKAYLTVFAAAMVSVLYLIYLELDVILKICLYCTWVHIDIFILFCLEIIIYTLKSSKP